MVPLPIIRIDMTSLPAIQRAYQALLAVEYDMNGGGVTPDTRRLVDRALAEVRK